MRLTLEWGSPHTRYQVLFLTGKKIMYAESGCEEKVVMRTVDITPAQLKGVNQLMDNLSHYNGNAAVEGMGFVSYFFTFWHNGRMTNCFAVFALGITSSIYNGLRENFPVGSAEDIFYHEQEKRTFYRDTVNAAQLHLALMAVINRKK